MPVDIDYLKQRGISSGAYKKLFTAEKLSAPVQKLVDTIGQRIHSGRESNLRDYRLYWAIDLAHEAPLGQTTPTFVNALLSRNLKADDMLKELAAYGLSEKDLFLSVDIGNGVTKKVVNPPVFFNILVPLVKAYHTIRTARIYNERDKSPLFKFTPAQETDENRVKCDIVTGIVDKTAQWYGWPEYLKTAIQHMLKYGIMLAFPKEEWHCEEQVIGGTTRVIKEGLRYDIPHPTRMGYDLYHPAPTINTDTGCEWAFHWSVTNYGAVLDNRMYWNKKAITFGTNWMDQPLYRNYFSEVYPCQLKFPTVADPTTKREDKAAYYGTSERDSAIFLTEFFWKIIPSRWGLGDYKYPVWHRFTVASDNTILWAAPCAYNPLWFMGYDFDANAGTPSSFSLECIPWQDHLGNLLTQMILTAKQNLANVTYYDRNLVDKKDIENLENLGERKYRSLNFIPFDSLKLARAGIDHKQAFHRVEMPYRSLMDLQQLVPMMLNVMERILQITAQETGAAGPHYQSKTEIDKLHGSSENRINYTSSSVDAGIDAWKQQGYEANMAYRDNEVTAEISRRIPNIEKILKDIGFEIKGIGPRKRLVGGSKASLNMLEFSRTNVVAGENLDPQMAATIFQTLGVIAQKPEFVMAVGVPRIIELLEQAAKFAGAPQDFDITTETDEDGQANIPAFMEQLKPILQQLQQNILGTVMEKVAAPAAKSAAEQGQRLDALEALAKELQGIYRIAEANQQKAAIKAQETAQQMQIRQAEFEAEEQRKQQAHAAEMQRAAEKAAIESQLEAGKATVAMQLTEAEARSKAEVSAKQADSAIAITEATTRAKIESTQQITDAKVAASKEIAAANVAKAKKSVGKKS